MKVLRRNATTVVAVFSLVLLATLWWRASTLKAVVAIQEPPSGGLTVVERDATLKVLTDVALDLDALVALNLSSDQAESILSTALTWRSANASNLALKQADIDAALTNVRNLEKSIALGPAQEGQEADLVSAVASLVSTRAAYQTALDPLRSSVSLILSTSQRTTWTAIQTGHDSTMPMRMLALSDSQRLSVSAQWQEYQCELASTGHAASEEWNLDSNALLTPEQQTVAASYAANFVTASEVVAAAVAEVLRVNG